MQLFIL